MAILAMPVIVIFVLRIVASIADARIAERSKRVLAAIERAESERRTAQTQHATTSVSVLTEEPPRDQG
jgi:type II secretory pathway pseudopilin PulG